MLTKEVKEFTQGCINCIIYRAGERIPRPLATSLHGQKPNEVVHMDFLYMGIAEKRDVRYVLVLNDDVSSYTWLFASSSPDAETAAGALAKWIAAFGSMDWLVSDRGSHFTASIISILEEEEKIRHYFTTAYCPWENGTVERLCKEVIRAGRVLLSEWKMQEVMWPRILETMQAVINQSGVERLGKEEGGTNWRSPMQIFMGRKPRGILARPQPITEI